MEDKNCQKNMLMICDIAEGMEKLEQCIHPWWDYTEITSTFWKQIWWYDSKLKCTCSLSLQFYS